MAIEEENIFHSTNSLIRTRPQKHFRAHIEPTHWQLRSIIGSEQGHIVYFPGGPTKRKVIKLDVLTREFETLRVLQFPPQCLVSRNGWLCCGGESGEFVAIPLATPAPDPAITPDLATPDAQNTGETNPDTTAAAAAVTDSATSSVLDIFEPRLPSSSDSSPPSAEDALRSFLHGMYAVNQSFGQVRMNSITLWFPDEDVAVSECAYSHPVAVLSNNDKNIIFVTLEEGESAVLDTITLPDCVNRAVISPDGSLCAAICDDPYLYIQERSKKKSGQGGYTWLPKTRVHLKSQRVDDKSDNRGSFAICFNKTGRHLAVGTQYGMISIFDTRSLLDDGSEPLLAAFGSSRPNSEAGAVRDMAFCPGPFDLLAWTENKGRVGVADIRSNCVSRQIIHLDKDGYVHFDIVDKQPKYLRTRGDSLSERYDSLLNETAATAAEGPAAARGASASRALEAEIRRLNAPLSREETMVLDAMREINRRRRDAGLADGPATSSNSGGGGGGGGGASASRPSRERSTSVTRANFPGESAVRDGTTRLAYTTWQESFGATNRLMERAWAEENQLRRGALPPIRAARLAADTAGGAAAASTGPATGSSRSNGASGSGSVTGAAASSSSLFTRTDGPTGNSSANRYRELDARYNIGWDNDGFLESRRELEILFRPGRSQATTVDYENGRGPHGSSISPGSSSLTSGMSWSEDGRTLFIGATDGIYEFQVDVQGRKFFPSITMR